MKCGIKSKCRNPGFSWPVLDIYVILHLRRVIRLVWIGLGNRIWSNSTKLFANRTKCAIQLNRTTIVQLDSLRIYYFPLGRSDSKISGFAGCHSRPQSQRNQSNLANLIGWEYESNTLHILRKSGPTRVLDLCHRPEGSWALGTSIALAYGGWTRSTCDSQKLGVLPKRHENSLFLRH